MNRNAIVCLAGISLFSCFCGPRSSASYDLDSAEAAGLVKQTLNDPGFYTTGLHMRQDDGVLASASRISLLVDRIGFQQLCNSLHLKEVGNEQSAAGATIERDNGSPQIFNALWSHQWGPSWWTPERGHGQLYLGEINGQKHAIQYSPETCQLYWFAMPMLRRTPNGTSLELPIAPTKFAPDTQARSKDSD